MKRICLALSLALCLVGCVAGEHRDIVSNIPEKCFFSIQVTDSVQQKKEGFFLYVDEGGDISGRIYKRGELEDFFGGGTAFSDVMRQAFRKAAIPEIDWVAHSEMVRRSTDDRTHTGFTVLDGWTLRIQMDFEGSKCDFTMNNAGSYIHHYANEDAQLKKLDELLETIAAEYGRTKMHI